MTSREGTKPTGRSLARTTLISLASVTMLAAVAGCSSSSATSTTSGSASAAGSAAASSPGSQEGPTVTANGVTVSGPKDQAPIIKVTPGEPAPTGEVKKDVYVGTGAEIKAGGAGTFQYSGVLFSDGSTFDSSWQRGEPVSFSLSQVIPGWQQGIPGMKEGGRRLLIVPPSLAYGNQAIPGIPPNSTLVFVVDLVKVL